MPSLYSAGREISRNDTKTMTQFEQLTGRLDQLADDIAEVRVLSADVPAILVALKGNGLGASEGVIERVHKLERADEKTALEVRRLWQKWDRLRWVSLGIGIGGGAIGGWVSTLIQGGGL